jgi:hypothetical protein
MLEIFSIIWEFLKRMCNCHYHKSSSEHHTTYDPFTGKRRSSDEIIEELSINLNNDKK